MSSLGHNLKVLMPLADGVEEMEAIIMLDVFRRVPWMVSSASLKPGPVTTAHGVRLMPDVLWSDIDPAAFDLLAIPGGQAGTAALVADERILAAVRAFAQAAKWIAAICAGPLVLEAAGVLAGRRATCHPAVPLTQTRRLPDRVVLDGKIATSQGPGSTLEFALKIVDAIAGYARAAALAEAMVVAQPARP